jgi:hypothetical protein
VIWEIWEIEARPSPRSRFVWRWNRNKTDTDQLPVPTPEELSEADAELRARVLPGTTEQELQQAFEKIPADPEKRRLIASLNDLLNHVPAFTPSWLVFVLVFWVAMKMNPDEVGALALAYAVAYNAKTDGK